MNNLLTFIITGEIKKPPPGQKGAHHLQFL